jgi:hypothetical protein
MELDACATTMLLVYRGGTSEEKLKKPLGSFAQLVYLDDPEASRPIVKVSSFRKLARMIRFAFDAPTDPEVVDEYGISLLDLLDGKFDDGYLALFRLAKSTFNEWKLPIVQFTGLSWDDLKKKVATPDTIMVDRTALEKAFVYPIEQVKNKLVCDGEKKNHRGDFYFSKITWDKFLDFLKLPKKFTFVIDVKGSHGRYDLHVLCNETLGIAQGNASAAMFWLELETCIREASAAVIRN